MEPARALVVSVHDVSPRTQAECRRAVAAMAQCGVARTALLVVPDHHGRGHFLEDAGFCAWLAELERGGHEIVTHGYYHRRARRPMESAVQKLATRVYTAGEGEFYDVDRATARDLVARGNGELRRAGLHPRGFIAPAWLLGAEAEAALRDEGVEYTTTLGAVTDLTTGRTWRSQSLVWSVRSAWRRAASLAWNATLCHRLRDHPLLRLAIHPVDLAHGAVWRQIRALATRAAAVREPMTYHAWITHARAIATPASPPA